MSIVNAKCPNCGASIQLDNVKSEGFCSYCGSKVKVEEAQKLMIQGTVKVDTSDELANLYQIARRAKDADNSENAHKYYDMILVKDPNSWEANFYVTYYQTMQCKIAEISSAAISLSNSFSGVLGLIKNHVVGYEEQKKAVEEIQLRCVVIATLLYSASRDFYFGTDIEIRGDYASDHIESGIYSAGILQLLSTEIKVIFKDLFDDIRVEALDCSIVLYADTLCDVKNEVREEDFELYKEDFELIKKYKPDFEWPIKICETPSVSNESGCYVATSIYGSYDCPQVWTLRRFRDNTLENYWAGRTFIKTYYAISPTLVKWFGESSIFKCVLTPILDRMVRLLKDKGVSDKPYNDKY
jgi:DNA-directed RNA polymerase subunit RPC12/RpoP